MRKSAQRHASALWSGSSDQVVIGSPSEPSPCRPRCGAGQIPSGVLEPEIAALDDE